MSSSLKNFPQNRFFNHSKVVTEALLFCFFAHVTAPFDLPPSIGSSYGLIEVYDWNVWLEFLIIGRREVVGILNAANAVTTQL